MDFELLLVVATIVTGIGAGYAWMHRRRFRRSADAGAGAGIEYREPAWLETLRGLFPVFLIVLLIRSFLFEPFRIPSGSMMPSLLIGDFILVNKYTYGLRLPVSHAAITEGGRPERGDVVVFRYPVNPDLDYIKRVVGLPGDEVVYQGKRLYVNGVEAALTPNGVYEGVGKGRGMSGARLMSEALSGHEHPVLLGQHNFEPVYPCMDGNRYVVPEGSYFVMGDNRDNSNDSRFWCAVPEANLVGKAVVVWMNWDWDNGGIGWGRIGNRIP